MLGDCSGGETEIAGNLRLAVTIAKGALDSFVACCTFYTITLTR